MSRPRYRSPEDRHRRAPALEEFATEAIELRQAIADASRRPPDCYLETRREQGRIGALLGTNPPTDWVVQDGWLLRCFESHDDEPPGSSSYTAYLLLRHNMLCDARYITDAIYRPIYSGPIAIAKLWSTDWQLRNILKDWARGTSPRSPWPR